VLGKRARAVAARALPVSGLTLSLVMIVKTLRLWRRRPRYRFEGRIHEQKTHTMPTYLPERFETSTVRMRHYGYLRSRITAKDKSKRNIELLEIEARENPSPFNQYNLEMSLASASMRGCRAIIPAAAEYRPFSIAVAFLPWWERVRDTASASPAGLCVLQSSLAPPMSFAPVIVRHPDVFSRWPSPPGWWPRPACRRSRAAPAGRLRRRAAR
jgi:hypothetical protein